MNPVRVQNKIKHYCSSMVVSVNVSYHVRLTNSKCIVLNLREFLCVSVLFRGDYAVLLICILATCLYVFYNQFMQ